MPIHGHVKRRLSAIVEHRLSEEPVIVLQGPRSVGKSTLLREIATTHGIDVIDLDDPTVRDALNANLSLYLATPPPVCIDEYQKMPLVLDGIKARMNRSTEPGAFIITGSTHYQALPLAAQSLTGRLHVMTILPLSQGELNGTYETFLERLLIDPRDAVARAVASLPSHTSREEYIERVHSGGFPLALARSNEAARNRWFDDYIRLVLNRDVLSYRVSVSMNSFLGYWHVSLVRPVRFSMWRK